MKLRIHRQLGVDYLSQTLKGNNDVTETVVDMDDAVKRADTVIRELPEFSKPTEPGIKTINLNAVLEESLIPEDKIDKMNFLSKYSCLYTMIHL